MTDETVTVNREYLNYIEKDSHLLECLYSYGVEEWEGFAKALDMYHQELQEFDE